MRALVVGGSGQVGGWLLRHLAGRGIEAVGTYATAPWPGLLPFDAADASAADRLLERARPDLVFYPAGFTWVDGCERDPARCDAANRAQPLALARAAAPARFVMFSTDYVFDGTGGPNGEADATAPLSTYGRSKRDAERELIDALRDRALVVRTAWVYGPERQGKNFAYQVVKALCRDETLTCPSDQCSSPSYGPDVASTAVELALAGESGVWHAAGPETVPRPAFASAIARAFGLDERRISARPTAELGQGAPRPLQGGLRCDRLGPGRLRPMAAALDDFVASFRQGSTWKDPRS